jgi:CRISPR-associated exonuclease Cas4
MITGTQFNYFFICHRKLWLFSNGIQMEHTSEMVYDGKLVHEYSYPQRTEKYQEIEIGGIKIDYFDPKNKVIHEVKRSDKIETAHEWQLKYYIYVLEKLGVEGVTGILEYPVLRKTDQVFLSNIDREEIEIIESKITGITSSEMCPERLQSSRCKNCSYFDFCWSGETEELI